MAGCCLEGCSRVAPHTALEGGNKEDRRLEEVDRGGHGAITGRGATEGRTRFGKTKQYVIGPDTRCPDQDSNGKSPEHRCRALLQHQ